MRRLLLLLCFVLLSPALFAAPAVPPLCPAGRLAPSRPAITGVAFAAFYVSEEAAAERFYRDELGLRAVAGANGATRYPVNRSQWIETLPSTSPVHESRLAAVGLTVADVTQMRCFLQSKGIRAVSWPGRADDAFANGSFAVHDPEGNTVVFVQHGQGLSAARGTPSPNAVAGRIIHVGFTVQSEAAQNAFYRDVLGFRRYWRGGHDDRSTDYVSQQVPDGTDWIEYMLNVKPDASAATRGVMNHVSLGVEHMPAVVAQLQRNGCGTEACTGSKLGRDGKVQLNLYDPDHSRVELMEFAPTGTTCCSPYTGPMPSSRDPL